MTALEFHPFANLFPLIEGADFDNLVEDVRARGVHDPIDLWQGKILDGRNRYRAAQAAGVEIGPQNLRHFRPELYGDPLDYVLSKNLKRRHLDDRQRASIAGKIAQMARGRPSDAKAENPPIGGISVEKAAAQLNVAPRQVERARVVHEHGVPEVCEALDRGDIAVSVAEKIARMPEAEQRAELPKALPNGARAIMGSRAEPDDSLDYFPTPPFATRALCEVILPRYCITRSSTAWEPACGEGHMAEVLAEYFRDVVGTDVHDFGYGDVADFLNPNVHCFPDWIITNPPFNDKAEAFVLRAIEVAAVGVAMFLRLQWLETIGRYERIFKPHPPALIAQFSERVPLCKGRWDPDGSTATAYLWIVWNRIHRGPTEFAWIPPGQRERLTRPDDRERFTAQPVARRAPEELEALSSIGESVGCEPLIRSGAGEPESDPGFSAGSPLDDSELDIPDRLKRDANNRAPFHQQDEKSA